MNILCTICARQDSKGVKNKALKKINGKTLIEISIKQAFLSNLFDEIVVSTDSKKIQNIAIKSGAKSWFLRSKKLSNDKISKTPAIKDIFQKSEIRFKKKFDICIDLDVTSPLRKLKDIKNALKIFLKKKKTQNLFSVCEARRNPYFNMIEVKNRTIDLVKKPKNLFKVTNRQTAPQVFDMNASIYIWKRSAILKSIELFNKDTDIYIMPQSRSIDIDTDFDLKLIRLLSKKQHA
tara:strand:- start:5 stop:709 length:705 start_codon:yes stop_codon:yes gene_type:complete